MSAKSPTKLSMGTPGCAFRASDTLFKQQVAATREALKNFSVISSLNAPGPTTLAMEEVINVTVRHELFVIFFSSYSGAFF